MEPEVKYLEHSGILGMKWGLRRFQNPDGSLTPAGKERYAKERSKLDSKYGITKKQGDYIKGQSNKAKKEKEKAEEEKAKEKEKPKEKTVSNMTDDELKAAIARLNLETQYLNALPKTPESKSFVVKFLEKHGDELVNKVITKGIEIGLNAVEESSKNKKAKKENADWQAKFDQYTDSELDKLISRKAKENQYKDLLLGKTSKEKGK